MKIPTKDLAGKPNGYVLTVWSALEQPGLRPDQVYLTSIEPHSRKGPHLHMKRRGVFVCIQGSVRIVTRTPEGSYVTSHHGEAVHFNQGARIVPPGYPCALYNDTNVEALVLNLPSPAWSAEDPDEHPVPDWIDQ